MKALFFTKTIRWILLALALGCAPARAAFDPIAETFAFGNETFFAYGNQHHEASDTSVRTSEPYSRRCFVLCRAAMQFHQFVHFAPEQPRISEAKNRELVRQISRIPVSQKRNAAPIIVPGFANLQEFSRVYPRMLQQNLGTWWPTYLRFGNWRMVFPFPRYGQEKLAREIVKTLERKELVAIYITRFKPLNHCLVVHGVSRTKTGLDFAVYDPNLPGKICHLAFDSATRSFVYQRTWYHPGGRVNALQVYHTRWL